MERKILMVCLGNICRSPLADGLLRHKIQEQNLSITVDSCGTAGYHVGEKPDSRMIQTAKNKGVEIAHLRARQFEVEDFDNFDEIYVMDESNYNNVVELSRSLEDQQKVKLILDLIDDKYTEVPDPYYGGQEGFELVFDLLDRATDAIINK